MKVAIILYGETRNLQISAKSWKFMKELDCDFYVSTWSKTEQISSRQEGRFFYQEITEEYIRNILGDCVLEILDENEISKKYNLNYNCEKSKFHIKNAYELIKKSGVEYDFLMITRSDQYFVIDDKTERLLTLNNHNTIYPCGEIYYENGVPKINDIFFWGNSQTMKYFLDNMIINDLGLHDYFAREFLRLGVNIEGRSTGISNVTVRPNALELEENEINFDNLVIKSGTW